MIFEQELMGDLIAVLMEDPDPSVIQLPDWQRSLRGKVVAVGPGEPLPGGGSKPMETKVGDAIVFTATAGMESGYKGESIRIMRDEDVLAVLE
jgi:chaperonin GroES